MLLSFRNSPKQRTYDGYGNLPDHRREQKSRLSLTRVHCRLLKYRCWERGINHVVLAIVGRAWAKSQYESDAALSAPVYHHRVTLRSNYVHRYSVRFKVKFSGLEPRLTGVVSLCG